MPYSKEHTEKTRKTIVESARILFNRDGFSGVSIEQIMAEVGLTRGGFYNHFKNKDELYAEAVASFMNGRGKTWRDEAGVDPINGGPETVCAMIDSYLSDQHLSDIDGQCPMSNVQCPMSNDCIAFRCRESNPRSAQGLWVFGSGNDLAI